MSLSGRVLVLVAATLIVGAGLCVFDAHDTTGPDLCGVVLLPVVGLAVMGPQRLAGGFFPALAPIHPVDPLETPVPPPKA